MSKHGRTDNCLLISVRKLKLIVCVWSDGDSDSDWLLVSALVPAMVLTLVLLWVSRLNWWKA